MLIVTGAVAYDYIFPLNGRFSDYIIPEKLHVINISCVVDRVEPQFGGTAGNQAYTLGMLGTRPLLLAAAGRDFGQYDQYLRNAGVDTRYVSVFEDIHTSVGFALYDKDDNQIWGFAKNSMAKASRLSLRSVEEPISLVLITPDEFTAVKNYLRECQEIGLSYAFDPAFDIPKLSPSVLRKGITNAEIVFGNDYEIALMKKRTGLTHKALVDNRIIITTLGKNGSVIETDGKKIVVKPAKPKKVVSPSGAGDAYRAGFLSGYLRAYDLKICGQMGSVSAAYALEHRGTIEHSFTSVEFVERYYSNYKENLVL